METVSVEIPIELLSRVRHLGVFSVRERTCRTEVNDLTPCGFDVAAHAAGEQPQAQKVAEAMTELMELLQQQPIPDYQI